ncbi:MAG: chorismate-binding protein [Acidimicrobiia bacterium]|nr:chorismate-binding protein [Acidimicrobiia bacterium]
MRTAQPDRDTFRALAREHTVVPVWCELLGDCETPVSAYMKLRRRGGVGFLLESVVHGDSWGRWSFLGRDAEFVIRCDDGSVSVEGACPVDVAGAGDAFDAVTRLLDHAHTPELAGLPPLHAGLVGYWGYDTIRFAEPTVPITNPDPLGAPEMLLLATGTLVAFDHFRQRLVVLRNVYVPTAATAADVDGLYDAAGGAIAEVRDDLATPLAERPPVPDVPAHVDVPASNMTPEQYMDMVRAGQEYILAGDCFQVVLSQRFSRPITSDPFDVHRALRIVNPSPYMTFLEHPDVTIVCASPEELVRYRDGAALTRPIAGTRWRGADETEDAALGRDLLADEKERAEHVMLVDLARNDLGRFGRYGTVRVEEFMQVETFSHVMHLCSTVTSSARPGVGPMDVLRATFPAGTVSGAPKVRAMQIIDELEPTRRGPYAGVVGYVDYSGNLDTALTLRTAVVRDGVAQVQAAAGIVADSVPATEYDETCNKARAVLVAIEAAERLRAGVRE